MLSHPRYGRNSDRVPQRKLRVIYLKPLVHQNSNRSRKCGDRSIQRASKSRNFVERILRIITNLVVTATVSLIYAESENLNQYLANLGFLDCIRRNEKDVISKRKACSRGVAEQLEGAEPPMC